MHAQIADGFFLGPMSPVSGTFAAVAENRIRSGSSSVPNRPLSRKARRRHCWVCHFV